MLHINKKYYFILIFIFLISFIFVYLFWFGIYQETKYGDFKLKETYIKLGENNIGRQLYRYNICNDIFGCMDGQIKGIELSETEKIAYIYYEPNYKIYDSINKDNNLYFFHIEPYYNSNHSIILDKKSLPIYFLLTDEKLVMYGEDDINNLTNFEQKIFLNLKKENTILINGKLYEKLDGGGSFSWF